MVELIVVDKKSGAQFIAKSLEGTVTNCICDPDSFSFEVDLAPGSKLMTREPIPDFQLAKGAKVRIHSLGGFVSLYIDGFEVIGPKGKTAAYYARGDTPDFNYKFSGH